MASKKLTDPSAPAQMRRVGVLLTLRSDGQARANDQFELRGDRPQAPPFADPQRAYVVARPLPMTLLDDSVVFDRTPAPLMTYRVDESMWMLTDASRRMYGMTGESIRAVSKHVEWRGILIQGDDERLIIYDPKSSVSSVVNREHVIAIDMQAVSPEEAAYFGRQKVCLMRFTPKVKLDPSKTSLVELSYDLQPRSTAYSVQHSLVYRRGGTLDISTYVEVSNESGIDLENASVKIIERRRDVGPPVPVVYHQSYQQRPRSSAKKSKSQRRRQDSSSDEESSAPAAMAPAPSVMAQASSETLQEMSREWLLNTPDVTFSLTQSSRTKILAYAAENVAALLRYDIIQDSVPFQNFPVSDWRQYADALRVLKWSVDKSNLMISGSVIARSERFGGQLLHDSPAYLDAWEVCDDRYSLKLGSSGLVKHRSYVESSTTRSDLNIRTDIVRTDLLVTLREAGEAALLKLVVRTSQPRVKPTLVAILFRERMATPGSKDESDVAPKAIERMPVNWSSIWFKKEQDIVRPELTAETSTPEPFVDYKPETENSVVDNDRKELSLRITRTALNTRTQTDPYLVSVFYSTEYAA